MKLVTFTHNKQTRIGAVVDDWVIDGLANPQIPDNMIDFLSAGLLAQAQLKELIATGKHRLALAEVQLHAPVPKPRKYLGIGLNYAEHIEETGRERP